MRILHLIPGSGGTFYCQNCLRDHILIRALRARGHDVVLVPLYLPMYGGAVAAEANAPLFFGGISIYVREKLPFLRRMPGWLDRLLNLPALLRQAALREGSTNASGLGSMTLSMLEGQHGNQGQEFERFLDWLCVQPRPDVIHISNALLLGFVPAIREVLDTPFICTLQDEEPWVNAMTPPYDRLCWEAMMRHGKQVARFIATSRWYAQRMAERLNLAPDKIAVLYPGIDLPPEPPAFQNAAPPIMGYLSRLNPAQGFEDIVDAFLELKREPALASLRLRATGGATPADTPFMTEMETRLGNAGFLEDTEIDWNFQSAPGEAFFRGLTVMCTPSREGEAFGMHIIEAMARGIPVVQPRAGAYPELIGDGESGILYDPETPHGLTDTLRAMLTRPEEARRLGGQGYLRARELFSAERMAVEMIALYESVCDVSPEFP
ncbi:MAG TPA: glycosyltransferase family 4 protein [Candidatus Hydrogenedentes bacterium]|nr:MAG: D-inositol 3-phosphate glycosyltransferase [Candidatus Hydrogenedentes bacterium ADurb.Bin179]HOH29320.1 glycosyltransferase family 4 protein [Candidatus Hydrogenedentota bacterium]